MLIQSCTRKTTFQPYYNRLKLKFVILKTVQYNPRKRTHDLALPTDVSAVIKQNFVCRMSFSDIY